MRSSSPPTTGQRIAVAATIGVLTAVATVICLRRGVSDFQFWWTASRLWLHGVDPYPLLPNSPTWPLGDRLFYPLPALLLTAPVAWLPLPIAGGVALGGASAVLSYLMSRDGWGRLWLFASPSFVMAVILGQWSPMLCVAALSAGAGWLTTAKPTLGAAMLMYRMSWRTMLSAALFAAFTVILMPRWPAEWLANLAFVVKHPAPIATLGGCWIAVALLRWRRAEGRLLLAMACVPQLLFFADQLPLYLIARDRRESSRVVLLGWAACAVWYIRLHPGVNYADEAVPYVLAAIYLPSLLMVLARPNEGDVPPFVERMASRLPAWLRGAPAVLS